ncbi:bifunctional aspartate kinase/homoserine dehydrogenase I [Flavobacterium sp.]|uniref:bifunctional aspartate kinase/homoserine dehydrogenase I n=1 Tax=Flavobacterium sp. TaxID=239 RepID=UPI00391C1F67
MKTLKFGGTSVANATNIQKCVAIILEKAKHHRLAVVVSAFSGVTDLLLQASEKAAAKDTAYRTLFQEIESKHKTAIDELIPAVEQAEIIAIVQSELQHLKTLLDGCYLLGERSPRTTDAIAGMGELLSAQIIAKALQLQLPESGFKDSRELIVTDANYGKAQVDFKTTNTLIEEYFASSIHKVTLLPGFIARDNNNNTTTLGRGGSDYTAAIIANGINASDLEIWTDVNGMFTANPKLVKQARPIASISYQEAMELSHFGAKVLYPPTIQPVLKSHIPIWIKNTFEPEAEGTLICAQPQGIPNPIKGISHIDTIALVTLEGSGMIGVAGSSKRLFDVLSREHINVIFITQASSEHSICVGIQSFEAEKAKTALNQEFAVEMAQGKIDSCLVETDLCIVALVGENMKNHQGISGKMFSTLGKNNVNIRAIAQGASERNISVVINEKDVKKALNTLHERFFEDNLKQLNLFVMGVGNVGEKFLDQIHQQKKFLKENLKLNVRVVALANSKKMVFEEEGIGLKDWKQALEQGQTANPDEFIATVRALNLRNSIFVDNTANESVAMLYEHFLKESVAVVTCNKIACASEYTHYRKLKDLSRKYNAPFLFETNVGAGLPIIDTLKHLIASGDKVHKIQAVLSGSLNFIFNNFSSTYSFHDVVKEAGIQGFTEPDPKIDLSGVDVARKILILIRESGYQMNMEAIENRCFLPDACMQTTNNPDFFASLLQHEAHFNALLEEANAKESRIKFVAEFDQGKAAVGLQFIPKDHPFYNLEGKDNIVLFYTDRYVDQPLLIKGAGAGAAVTASGIFADVIRIGNF